MRSFLLASALCFISFSLFPQKGSYGYILSDSCFRYLPEYAPETGKLMQLVYELDSVYKKLAKDLSDFIAAGIPQPADSATRSRHSIRLQLMQDTLQRFPVFARQQYEKEAAKTVAKLEIALKLHLKEFSTKRGISIIAEMKHILHCTGCKNFTPEFITWLKGLKK